MGYRFFRLRLLVIQLFDWVHQPRYAALWRLLTWFLLLAFGLRVALLIRALLTGSSLGLGSGLAALALGTGYDLVTGGYWLVVPALLALVPGARPRPAGPLLRTLTLTVYALSVAILAFNVAAEWLFWDEFGVRYNFIAVDYLVYTNEVVGNIRESYPLEWLIPLVIIGALAGYYWLRPGLRVALGPDPRAPRRRVAAAWLLGVPLALTVAVSADTGRLRASAVADELGHNGVYQLFAAFRNNQLDYDSFYRAEKDPRTALRHLRPLLARTGDSFVHPTDLTDLTRHVARSADSAASRPNVVWITVESLSAEFLTRYGDTLQLTPNLDTLLDRSLSFDDLYATGTRTIRGLEALTLCLPPTPGYSIVKRPHNEGLFSTGALFDSLGYISRFLYGGYGYFDNMNYFFSHNGFQVTDRADFDKREIQFANTWGVCDEDLFNKALRVATADARTGRPFFHFLMTTSNHRPFTYPEGRIDIASHTGREGAVKYTDYAIGKFLRDARRQPWFANTIFVVVADHCAASAGNTEVPVERYHIPGLIYAPGRVAPRRIAGVMSQIDVAPTLLGLVGAAYDTKFFGHDVRRAPPGRAFLGTYQQVALLRDGHLTVLSPKQQVEAFRYNPRRPGNQQRATPRPADVRDAVAWYQGAAWAFTKGRFRGPRHAKAAGERL